MDLEGPIDPPTLKALVAHLEPHCQVLRPVRLVFKPKRSCSRQTLLGCYYEQERKPLEGARNQKSYISYGIQLLGIPSCYEKRRRKGQGPCGPTIFITANKVCFILDAPDKISQGCEWYVAAYYIGSSTEHQVGTNSIISPWKVDGQEIDHYEERPYRRIPVEVELLKEEEVERLSRPPKPRRPERP